MKFPKLPLLHFIVLNVLVFTSAAKAWAGSRDLGTIYNGCSGSCDIQISTPFPRGYFTVYITNDTGTVDMEFDFDCLTAFCRVYNSSVSCDSVSWSCGEDYAYLSIPVLPPGQYTLSYSDVYSESFYAQPASLQTNDFLINFNCYGSPVIVIGGSGGGTAGSGTGTTTAPNTSNNLGTIAINNRFPYAQSTNAACAVDSVRNVITIMGGVAQSEVSIAQRMTQSVQETNISRYQQDGSGLTADAHPLTQLNAALNPEGLTLGTHINYNSGLDAFTQAMTDAAQKGTVFLVGTYLPSSGPPTGTLPPLAPGFNHMIVFQPTITDGYLTITMVDSGRSNNGDGIVTTLTPQEAMATAVGNSNVLPVTRTP